MFLLINRSPLTINNMNCRDFRQNISLYVDDAIASADVRAAFDAHLDACPVCRAEFFKVRDLRRNLQMLSRPVVPSELTEMLRRSVTVELVGQKASKKPVGGAVNWRNLLEFNVMPYAIGTFASVLFFVMMFASLRTAMNAVRDFQSDTAGIEQIATPVMLANVNRPAQYETALSLSPADYAALRSPYTFESPSLNPKSAFVAFTTSLTRGEMSDEAVVIVADVFSNGIARIADVIEPPHDLQKLNELERILNNDPAFVPAAYDKRPENMRVVIMIQKVDVSDENETSDLKNSQKF